MAQNYTEQLRKDNVRDAIYEDLQNNCEVLRTSWSGDAFPANPKVGQPCYRVDEDKLYYWDGYKWSQKGGGGSAELKTMELAAATSERVSITLEGARCLDKNMMFVFVDKIAQDPSTYSMNDDGTVVNFNPAIPANAAVTLRWFDTDVGTFDTAIFASDAEFAAGELTNRAPNVKQVHSLSDMVASKLSGLELMDVGFAPLGIDESKNKRRYLNGQLIIQSQFPAFTAAVKARMTTMANAFTTEENWQAEKTNSKLGQCGKFVVDDTAGTIRLPAVVNAQGLVDLALIGGIKNESLPNIAGGFGLRAGSDSYEWSGAFNYSRGAETNSISGSSSKASSVIYNFNASRSSSTYQDNAPVQQEAVQYPYYIQVATGVEETLPAIREYEINTPFFFGQSMYSDVAPDNASWLVSNGQYNAKTVYPDYYDWLLEQRNAELKTMYGWHSTTGTQAQILFLTFTNTLSVGTEFYGYVPTVKAGTITAISGNNVTVKNDIVNTTSTTAIDVSDPVLIENRYIYDTTKVNIITKSDLDNWRGSINTSDYDFVINTTDQTFRLPLLNGEEDLPDYSVDAIAHTLNSSSPYTANKSGLAVISPFDGDVNYRVNGCEVSWQRDEGSLLNSQSVHVLMKKGDVLSSSISQNTDIRFYPFKGNGSLYYYVGDTVQDASLINAGAVLGQLATKTNFVEAAAASMPSGRYIDLTLGASGSTYTAPANGWLILNKSSTNVGQEIRLTNQSNQLRGYAISAMNSAGLDTMIPCRKGDIIHIYYSAAGSVEDFRFVYAEGEE